VLTTEITGIGRLENVVRIRPTSTKE